jgi:DNA replication protein DnaC
VRSQANAEILQDVRRDIEKIPGDLRRAIRECTTGAASWPLFVYGPAGTGKTCAALCLVDRVARSRYWTEESLCQDYTDAMMGDLFTRTGYEISTREFWERERSAALVVVDELAARYAVSEHRRTVVKTILDIRDGRPLILISNTAPEDIANIFDDRVASRALCGTVVELNGADRRIGR